MDSEQLSLTPDTQPSTPTSGNIPYSTPSKPMTVDEELQKTLKYLDEYEARCWLPTSVNENTINLATDILNTDFSSFTKTPDECAECSVILAQYAFNLQRVINKDKSQLLWADERIMKIIAPRLKMQQAYNFNERKTCAIAEDVVATRLLKLKIESELRLTRIESLYFCVKNLSDKYSELAKSLRGIR